MKNGKLFFVLLVTIVILTVCLKITKQNVEGDLEFSEVQEVSRRANANFIVFFR